MRDKKQNGGDCGPGMRERILRAAFELMAERNMDQVSVREIVEKVKVTKPVLYYYFKDKNDLCRELVKHHIEQFRMAVESWKYDSPEAFLELIFSDQMSHFKSNPKIASIIFQTLSMGKGHKLHKIFDHALHARNSLIKGVLVKMERDGRLSPGSTPIVMHAVWGFLAHTVMHMNRNIPGTFGPDLPKQMARLIITGANNCNGGKHR